jgi:hypothetical protein
MNKTTSFIAMTVLCLNFCYGQEKQDCSRQTKSSKKSLQVKPNNSSVNQPYKFHLSGFKSGYQPGYIVTDDVFMKGKTIVVRNYTITQLFALALKLRIARDASDKQTSSNDHIIVEVRQPEKLKSLHCYKLVVPFYLTDNFYVIMHQSLNEEFPQYVVKTEKRGGEDVMVIRDKEY